MQGKQFLFKSDQQSRTKKRRGYFTGMQLLSHWQRRAKNCIETVNNRFIKCEQNSKATEGSGIRRKLPVSTTFTSYRKITKLLFFKETLVRMLLEMIDKVTKLKFIIV